MLVLVTRPPPLRPESRSLTSLWAASSANSGVAACPQDTSSSGLWAREIIQR